MHSTSRRHFLKMAGALGALGAVGGRLQASTNYQALVCIFLNGGNDGHNTVIPVSTSKQNYSTYAAARPSLALPQPQLLPISNGSESYGLHPLMPELASLYKSGNVAILANVGMLVKPITRQMYIANPLANVPAQLFSHGDQVNQWQSAVPDGSGNFGWGGLVEDQLQSYNAGSAFSPITSTAGCERFCTGQNTFAATVPVNGVSTMIGTTQPYRLTAVQQLMSFDNGLKLVTAANGDLYKGAGFSQALNAALKSAVVNTPFPKSSLGDQLKTVAMVMSVRNALGIGRQVFFCEVGGFDTHSLQSGPVGGSNVPQGQDALLQQLSQAMSQFFIATQEVGTDKSTVTFTASEFGRTLQPNTAAGTDHAWGSHHFIMGTGAAKGGPLNGGQMYGQFPLLQLGGVDDANSRGTIIPTTSVDQYAATLSQWFGLSSAGVSQIFPRVGNFATSNLGFLI